MCASLLQQVKIIATEIQKGKNKTHNVGLLSGKAGITLLFAYLSKVFPREEYGQITMDYLDELADCLANDGLHYNMSWGVAGIAFVFQHLRNMGLLDADDDLNLSQLDSFIDCGLDYDFKSGNWDPLHGIVGLGIYFLERNKETGEKKYLEKVVDLLADMSVPIGNHWVWITPAYKNYHKDNFNFGMAHGMPGVISFLAQVHRLGIRQGQIETILMSCIPFLLQYEIIDDPVYCFPGSVEVGRRWDSRTETRLAWCYGDLGMANALIHSGRALENDKWKNKGIEIALKTTLRTFKNSSCSDAPFCHGSTGIIHQYHQLYKLTKHDAFESATQRWLDITMNQFYKPGEYVGGYYSALFKEEKKGFELTSQYGLLDGSAGIALVYLSYFFNINPDWDLIFLTNV
ncbi:lanthionine synthetase C family protein [Segetibacter koreensis]|uniref:lanthionine synthetase C family protein n=1 Tax=Segetibacter koreensis TaxID=398037 RepID=UPI00036F8F93|nr:lanthionine synthetase C family protein [Segetibacter koreensis]